MSALSLRLPDELEHRLEDEAQREGVPRSEVVRYAINAYLVRRERERFMAELVAEAQAGYAHETIRSEALSLAEEGITLEEEAREQRTDATSEDRWWK